MNTNNAVVVRCANRTSTEGAEAPVAQDAKSENTGSIRPMSNAARRDASAVECGRMGAPGHSVPRLEDEDLDDLAEQLDGWPAADILAWAAERYHPRLTFATGFGAEGCVIIDLIGSERLPIDIFTLDTGLLFPETYELWRRLETRYGLTIRGARPALTVDEQAAQHGPNLWERHPDSCCEMRKVVPLRRELGRFDAWITAIRREQAPQRADARVVERDEKFGLIKINPLVRWTKRDVWKHLLDHEVPYNPLHDRGYPSIGCRPCTSPVRAGEDERAGRWRGHDKVECGLHGPVIPTAAPVPMQQLFPAFLKLQGRRVVVVGGGPVAAGKIEALLDAGAEVTVVAPEVQDGIERPGVTVRRRPFMPPDLDDAWLVVAAAPPEVNRRVAEAAAARRVFVNAVDDPSNASVYLGGVVRRAGVTVAVSTDGRAPALAGLLREGLDALLPRDLDAWLDRADDLRRAWRATGVPIDARRPQLLDALVKLYERRT